MTGNHHHHVLVGPGKAATKKLEKFRTSWTERNPTADSNYNPIENLPTYARDDLIISNLLGQGGFSNVFQAQTTTTTDNTTDEQQQQQQQQQVFALKQLKPSTKVNSRLLQICAADLALETAVLALMSHDNIIRLHGIRQGNLLQLWQEGEFFILLDKLHDTLEDRLVQWRRGRAKQKVFLLNARRRPSSQQINQRLAHVAIGLVKGMEYLHENGILYRDLKPANIGFDEVTDELKIFDFGLAKCVGKNKGGPDNRNSNNNIRFTRKIGTPRYMAPEMARGEYEYGFGIDVYSFMIVLWQLITDKVAYSQISTPAELKHQVSLHYLRPPLKGHVRSEFLRNLLETGWSDRARERPSFKEIRQQLEDYLNQQHHHQQVEQDGKKNEAKSGFRHRLSSMIIKKNTPCINNTTNNKDSSSLPRKQEELPSNSKGDDYGNNEVMKQDVLQRRNSAPSIVTVGTDLENELEV